jgi:hypothetical protein
MSLAARPRHRHAAPTAGGGAEANERLTVLTGTILLAGFAVEGVTLLALSPLLTVHVFLGMLLIGPVLLKISSTGYRFIRYYAGSAPYVRKGPPAPIARILGPFVILTSLAVLGTGVVLGVAGPGRGPWLLLHKASFVLWFGVMAIHVLTYAWRLPRLLRGPIATSTLTRAPLRWALVATSLAAGLLLAVLTVHLAAPWHAHTGG